MLWGILFLSSVASSSTGGNVVGPGGHVVTGSAYVDSVISGALSGVNVTVGANGADGADGTAGSNGADGANGASVIDIETSVNGVVHKEHYESKGTSSAQVVVVASASSSGASIHVSTTTVSSDSKPRNSIMSWIFGRHSSSTATSTLHSSTTPKFKDTGHSIFTGFSSMFGRIFSIFGF